MSKVYVMTDGRHYKIGMTDNDVTARIKQLQTGCATKLVKICEVECYGGALTVEKYLHHKCRYQRCVGEWFMLTDKELAAVLKTLADITSVASSVAASGRPWVVENLIDLQYDVDKTIRQREVRVDELLVEMANMKFKLGVDDE